MDTPETTRVSAATAKVLSTVELLEWIIRNGGLRLKDLASCATVCRLWSEPSLDELWSDARFADLLQVFPSVKKVGSVLQIEGFIATSRWDRFLHYSKRIVQLEVVHYQGMPYISDHLQLEFASSRPALPLFPRMKELRWDATYSHDTGFWISFSRILLADNLSEIHIYLPWDISDKMTALLHEIPACSRNVSRLFVRKKEDDDVHEDGVEWRPSHFLSQLPNLSELMLPSGLTGPDTLRTISRLPNLIALTIGSYLEEGTDFSAAVDPENSFPSLTSIGIQRGSASDIERLLNRISNKRNLEVLLVEFVDYTEPVVEAFVRDTCGIFPSLKKVTIGEALEDRPDAEDLSADSTGELLSLSRSTLYHLRHHFHLEYLCIAYYRPSEVTDDDFMELVEALPNLTRLEFCFLPLLTGIPCLTLRILHRLSNLYRLKPDLRGIQYLRLHVNASDWPGGSVEEFLLSEGMYPLRQLDTLCLDGSPISSVDDVTLYLGQVIPSSCKWDVDNEDSWDLPVSDQFLTDELEEMDSRRDKWREVRNQLRGYHRTQAFQSKLSKCRS